MLEYYYSSPVRLRQIRRGPLAPYLDGLAAQLRERGYQRITAQQILCIVGQFSHFLSLRGFNDAGNINESLAQEFLSNELTSVGVFRSAKNALSHVLTYLRQIGVVPEVEIPPAVVPYEGLIERYVSYLRDIRGLSADTCHGYAKSAERFLNFHIRRHETLDLCKLSGSEVLDYLQAWVNHFSSQSWSRRLATDTRSLLRFLHWDGQTDRCLAHVVPAIPRWRLSTVPRRLPWEQVQMLIDSVDTSSPEGMRDKAILLILATLGLRNHDVRTLEIGHIDWRESKIHLPKTKNMRARVLPLPQVVGEPIADYLLHGRPHLDVPFIFLRHKAPVGPMQTANAISNMIRARCEKLGLMSTERIGAHLLRHSLATRMVNCGVPIKEISDMLGHASIDTTAIYTKVDVEHLRGVALPLPGGAI